MTECDPPPLRLGLPKGRMQESVFALLKEAGIEIRSSGRSYRPTLSLPGFEVKILKPQNIVEMLHEGSRDLGFAGKDWVEELGVELDLMLETGLEPVRLVAAAPSSVLVNGALPERSLVVASEYERLTRRWFKKRNGRDHFVHAHGATEVFPPDDADCIVDNTATGATLQANNLIIVDELMQSSTCLYANPTVKQDEAGRAKLSEMGIVPGDKLVPPDELDVDTIREYYRYSDWASACLCGYAEKLPDEQLDRTFEMGIGTLRKTLLHIYDAEAWWCANWTGAENKEYQQLPPTTSIAELKLLLEKHIASRDGFFAKLTAADLQEIISAQVSPELWLRFRLGETMLQLPPHGTHHRAQSRNMLRHLGVETQEIDYLDWYDTTQR